MVKVHPGVDGADISDWIDGEGTPQGGVGGSDVSNCIDGKGSLWC